MFSMVLLLVGLAAAAYAALLVWFRANEPRLLFAPEAGPLAAPPQPLPANDVRLTTSSGATLVARVIAPPPRGFADPAWILYFHGAAGNVGTAGYNEAWGRFHDLGLGVFAIDYRGYGESTGTPSEAAFYEDAEAAFLHLSEALKVPRERIVLYGYSLGSAVAIDLACKVSAAALIVEGALLSVPARAKELYPYVPAHWLARNRFASIDKIARVNMPKLFVHARADESVPFSHGERLFARATAPKWLQPVGGGHTTAFKEDPMFFKSVSAFLERLGLPVADPRGGASLR